MIKVFVTGVGGGIGQGIIKSLKLIKDLEIMIIGGDITQFSAGMYCVDRSYIIPSVSDLNYIEKLIAILNSESINYFFPGNDKELLLCASNIEKIENSTKATLCISNEETIRITNDKYLTYQFLVENDIPAPRTRLLNDNLNIFQSEVILKPRIGFGSKGIKQINIEDLDKIDDVDKEKYMIQEIIGNDENEFTCTVVKVDNNISDIVILKRDLRFGDTYKAFPVSSKKITNYVSDIAKKLDFFGSCNFQLRFDYNQNPLLFEINCRFSGTTPFCSLLGLNPVEFFLKNHLGVQYNYTINYDKIILRHWAETVIDKDDTEKLKNEKYINPSNPLISNL